MQYKWVLLEMVEIEGERGEEWGIRLGDGGKLVKEELGK